MFPDLVNLLTPDVLMKLLRENHRMVIDTLQRFDAFTSFGKALNVEQQTVISNNLNSLAPFFNSELGRAAVENMAVSLSRFLEERKAAG